MIDPNWEDQLNDEIKRAIAAREAGNEGKARVCARRAAGLAAGAYLRRVGLEPLETSAYNHLRAFNNLPGLPEHASEVSGYFLLRVTPDHILPVDVDLIDEAMWLYGFVVNPSCNPPAGEYR